ncbi:MAG: helix-turn-helix domain-containing protein [Terriglobia bacterium]
MIANERIKAIRIYRKLKSKELARASGISPSEITGIERRTRSPKTETLQKIAAALEVRTSYLLGEINSDARIGEALRQESLEIFLRDNSLPLQQKEMLREICRGSTAPDSVKGWQDLLNNLSISGAPGFEPVSDESPLRR